MHCMAAIESTTRFKIPDLTEPQMSPVIFSFFEPVTFLLRSMIREFLVSSCLRFMALLSYFTVFVYFGTQNHDSFTSVIFQFDDMERKGYVIPVQHGGNGIGFQTPTFVYTEEPKTFHNVL